MHPINANYFMAIRDVLFGKAGFGTIFLILNGIHILGFFVTLILTLLIWHTFLIIIEVIIYQRCRPQTHIRYLTSLYYFKMVLRAFIGDQGGPEVIYHPAWTDTGSEKTLILTKPVQPKI